MTALRTLVYDRLEVAHPGYAVASVADRLFAAIEAGDVDAVASMWSDDVTVWHSGDTRPSEKKRAMRVIDWFVSSTAERHYDILDRRSFDGGFVQQHVLHGTTRSGEAYSLRVGIIIRRRKRRPDRPHRRILRSRRSSTVAQLRRRNAICDRRFDQSRRTRRLGARPGEVVVLVQEQDFLGPGAT